MPPKKGERRALDVATKSHWVKKIEIGVLRRLSDAGSHGAGSKGFHLYPRSAPTGLDVLPRDHGLWPYALTTRREDPMSG